MTVEKENYIRDISEIKNMMERSSRFMSLSGLSGILVGTYALIASYFAYKMFYFSDEILYHSLSGKLLSQNVLNLIMLAISVLILAVGTSIFLSYKQAKKSGEPIWTSTTKRLAINLIIPLVTGGIFILIMFSKGAIGLIAPCALIFYGLALVNASKYTLTDIRYLGICEIILGLLSTYFIGYGLLFWAVGFGVLHIVYGVVMYKKYQQ